MKACGAKGNAVRSRSSLRCRKRLRNPEKPLWYPWEGGGVGPSREPEDLTHMQSASGRKSPNGHAESEIINTEVLLK